MKHARKLFPWLSKKSNKWDRTKSGITPPNLDNSGIGFLNVVEMVIDRRLLKEYYLS